MLHIIEESVLNNNVFYSREYNSRKLLNEIIQPDAHIGTCASACAVEKA